MMLGIAIGNVATCVQLWVPCPTPLTAIGLVMDLRVDLKPAFRAAVAWRSAHC